MNELYFIKASKINARVSDLIIDGSHINVEGYRYERLIRKPKGRSIERKLQNIENQERLIIYA